MAFYRLYCFDGVDRISGVHEIDAETDDDAVAQARAIDSGIKCELWLRDRLVSRFHPEQRQ
jgi:hypothetical protein